MLWAQMAPTTTTGFSSTRMPGARLHACRRQRQCPCLKYIRPSGLGTSVPASRSCGVSRALVAPTSAFCGISITIKTSVAQTRSAAPVRVDAYPAASAAAESVVGVDEIRANRQRMPMNNVAGRNLQTVCRRSNDQASPRGSLHPGRSPARSWTRGVLGSGPEARRPTRAPPLRGARI
jgi:hypothetical protein